MADGNLVRQSNVGKDSVVFGPSVYDLPLLPYEKQLIANIGVTEEEYRKFVAEVKRRGALRPAEYEHIPDIQATGTEAVLISFAISLVLTGVSYLLTPKPKAPEAASRRTQLDLGSVTGSNRFTPSRGFDSLAELADYASPIPIIFGLYQKDLKVGGMLVTPKLVWSRMSSHGTQQAAKLMFVVGEQGVEGSGAPDGIEPPDLRGIFLGNNALDAIYEDFFAFYWKRNTTASGFKRLKFGNILWGSPEGDPSTTTADNDAFFVPDGTNELSADFCHAYSPANNTKFGVYGAIANGTGYRVNYEVISIPKGTQDDQEKQALVLAIRRFKIVGDQNAGFVPGAFEKKDTPTTKDEDHLQDIIKQRQEGRGRNYSPRMGLLRLERASGGTETVSGNNQFEEHEVTDGDKLIFILETTKIPEDFYQRSSNRGGENVDDINQSVNAEQIAADDALQIGEHFAIGNTKWLVVDRTPDPFNPEGNRRTEITLKCTDVSESRSKLIGLVSESLVINPDDKIGHTGDGFRIKDVGKFDGIGAGFYPLTKIATGIVRNNRAAIVTEIGLRSRVFQRLNGLCAFNSTPTPAELEKFDEKDVSIRSGTFTGTIVRSSVFQVFVREAGLDENGNQFAFRRLSPYFVVRGSKPVDQYNFIRFIHPRQKEFEFKFVPIPASELRKLRDEEKVIVLNSVQTTSGKQSFVPVYSNGFKIEAPGFEANLGGLIRNKEFIRKPRPERFSDENGTPVVVARGEVLPADQRGKFVFAKEMEFVKFVSNDDDITIGRSGAFFHEIFGSAQNSDKEIVSKSTREAVGPDGNSWIKVKWTVKKMELSATHYARVSNNNSYAWSLVSAEIIGSSHIGDDRTVTFRRGLNSSLVGGSTAAYDSSTNPFIDNHPEGTLTRSGLRYRITRVDEFGTNLGRDQAYKHELFGSAAGKGVGETATGITTLNSGGRSLKLEHKATVVELPDGHFSGRNKGWGSPEEITITSSSGEWDQGDTVDDFFNIDIINPFYTGYDRVGYQYVVQQIKDVKDIPKIGGETIFEGQSQIADISFYRGLVQKSNESEPEHSIVYVNEIIKNDTIPEYLNMSIAGLSLKAGRNFTSLDQMRCWLRSGLHVRRLHPEWNRADNNPYDESDSRTYRQQHGPSHLFTDLVFFLMTDQTAGAGALMGMNEANANNTLLNQADFEKTSKFLHKQQLFFNGVIVERTNLRQYISDTAPYFLCNFIVTNGKFSLLPAIPHNAAGGINTGAVQIDQLFTSGNILEDTFKIEYLRSEERRPFKAVVRYREESENKLPQERVAEFTLGSSDNIPGVNVLPEEQFDLTQFCTSKKHAKKVAMYFLGLRKFVSHTISFSTTVEGLNLSAGSYIKVVTESSPYKSANNGTVSASGAVTSVEPLEDGTYTVTFFKAGSEDIEKEKMSISGGTVQDTRFHDSVFTIFNEKQVRQNIYVVEQLTFSQEGTVDIVASEHQCDDEDGKPVSKLAKLIAKVDE
jgi:hypothetical protein